MHMLRYLIIFCLLLLPDTCLANTNAFNLSPVDFFNESQPINISLDNGPRPVEGQNAELESLWAEPLLQPDGSTVYRTPPKPVLNFADNPNETTGRGYLEWVKKRSQKISEMQMILKKLTADFVTEYLATQQVNQQLQQQNIDRIAFFLLKGCPYCEQQKPIITNLLNYRKDLKIDVFVKGYSSQEIAQLPFSAKIDAGYSSSLGFNKFPTTLITDTSGKQSLIKGIIPNELINNLLSQKGNTP